MLTIIYDSDSSSSLSEDSSLAESKSSCCTNEFLIKEETHSMLTTIYDSDSSSTLSEDSSLAESKSSCCTNELLSTIWEETSTDLQSFSFRRTRRSGSIDPGVPPPSPPPLPTTSENEDDWEETPKMKNCKKTSVGSVHPIPTQVSLPNTTSFKDDAEYEDNYNDWNTSSRHSISLTSVRTGQAVVVSLSDDEFTFESCSIDIDSHSNDSFDTHSKMKNCKKTSVGSFHPIPTQVSLPNTTSFTEDDAEYEDNYNDGNTSSRHSISLTSVRTGHAVVVYLSDDEFTFESCSTHIDLHSNDSFDTHSLASFEDSENDFREGNEIFDMVDQLRDEPSTIRGKREAALRTQQRLDRKDTQKLDLSIRSSPEELDPLRRKISYSSNSKHLLSRLSESFFQPELRRAKKLKFEDIAGHRRRTAFKTCQMILERKIVNVLSNRDKMHKKILSSEQCEDEIQVYDSIMASPSNPQDDYNTSKTGLDIDAIEDDDGIQLEAESFTDSVLRENKRADLRDKSHRIEDQLERIRSNLGGSFSSLGEDSLGSRRRDSNALSPAKSLDRKSLNAEQQDPQGRLAHFQLKKQLSQKKLQVALDAAMAAILISA